MEKRIHILLQKNVHLIGVIGLLVVATIVFGVIGFNEILPPAGKGESNLVRGIDIIYNALRLFSLESKPATDVQKHWAVSLGRLSAISTVFSLIAIAALYALNDILRSSVLSRFYSKHFIVVGLNQESLFFIKDLIANSKKVVVIDDDFDNPLKEEINSLGIPLLLGELSDFNTLNKASIMKAKYVAAFTGDDLKNLEVLKCVIDSDHNPKLRFYVGIDNVMSYRLFEPGSYYSIANIKKNSPGLYISVFNIFETAAIELFENLSLASEVTFDNNSIPVKILIYDFNPIGSAVLRELLLLSHFPNGQKINITVFSEKTNDFYQVYRQVEHNINGKGLDLWDLNFVNNENNLPKLTTFNKIICCTADDNLSLKTILQLQEQYRESLSNDGITDFYYYCAKSFGIKQETLGNKLVPFGSLKASASLEHIVLANHEDAARYFHQRYATLEILSKIKKERETLDVVNKLKEEVDVVKDIVGKENEFEILNTKITNLEDDLKLSSLSWVDVDRLKYDDDYLEHEVLAAHDNNIPSSKSSEWLLWENLPLFKRRSNSTEKRHIAFKLAALSWVLPNKDLAPDKLSFDSKDTFIPYLTQLSEDAQISESGPLINDWFLSVMKQKNSTLTQKELVNRIELIARSEHARWNAFHVVNNWKYGREKSEENKIHNCLLSWKDLHDYKSDVVKYDYMNLYNITSLDYNYIDGIKKKHGN